MAYKIIFLTPQRQLEFWIKLPSSIQTTSQLCLTHNEKKNGLKITNFSAVSFRQTRRTTDAFVKKYLAATLEECLFLPLRHEESVIWFTVIWGAESLRLWRRCYYRFHTVSWRYCIVTKPVIFTIIYLLIPLDGPTYTHTRTHTLLSLLSTKRRSDVSIPSVITNLSY